MKNKGNSRKTIGDFGFGTKPLPRGYQGSPTIHDLPTATAIAASGSGKQLFRF